MAMARVPLSLMPFGAAYMRRPCRLTAPLRALSSRWCAPLVPQLSAPLAGVARPHPAALPQLLSRHFGTSALRRQQQSGAAGSSGAEGAKADAQQTAEEAAEEEAQRLAEEAYYADEPLAAKVSRCALERSARSWGGEAISWGRAVQWAYRARCAARAVGCACCRADAVVAAGPPPCMARQALTTR